MIRVSFGYMFKHGDLMDSHITKFWGMGVLKPKVVVLVT